MGGDGRDYFWIQDSMKDRCVKFPNYGTWQIKKKLSEKEWMALQDFDWTPSEAHAVYEFRDNHKVLSKYHIMTMLYRIPSSYPLPLNCDEGARFARLKQYDSSTQKEMKYLQRLTQARCTAAPRLLAIKEGNQEKPMLKGGWDGDEEFWVPGGYVVWILMEKVPGENLKDFFLPEKFSPQERQEIRKAFRVAMTEVERCGVLPMDTNRGNIIWNKESKRCYIVDFESANEWSEKMGKGFARPWSDDQYKLWNLDESRNM